MLYPGDMYYAEVTTHKVDGNRSDASSIAATLVRNGIDTAVTVAVTHKAVGVYALSVEIPTTWSRGDSICFRVNATVDTVTGNLATGAVVLGVPVEGTGPISLTIIVTDDASLPLEGAVIRMYQSSEDYLAVTDENGQAIVGRNAATWNVVITHPGYLFTPTTLVVSEDDEITYEMESLVITPSNPDFVTGYLVCYDLDGAPKEDVTIELQIAKRPTTVGLSFDTNIKTVTSNSSGIASFPNLVPTATYQYRGGVTKEWVQFIAPASGPFAMDSLLRRDP